MNSDVISAFIDDELQLGEKVDFVHKVHGDQAFKEEAIDLLTQEIRLRATDVLPTPPQIICLPPTRHRWRECLKPVGIFGSGLVTALILAAFLWGSTRPATPAAMHRFVLYLPDVHQAAITGDFTHWQAMEMHSAGRQGYWEIYLAVPPGEHRYSFVLDGQRQMADPTQTAREQDDFGGQNSILVVPAHAHI